MRRFVGREALAAPESREPRVRVAALILLEGRVVLVRHRAGSRTYHLLPGGGVNFGETIDEALRREVAEETGLQTRLGRLLFVSDTIDPNGSRHLVNITFEASVIGGTVTDTPQDTRVEAVDLIEPWRLPELDLRPPIADDLLHAIADGHVTATYLGSLFTPGP